MACHVTLQLGVIHVMRDDTTLPSTRSVTRGDRRVLWMLSKTAKWMVRPCSGVARSSCARSGLAAKWKHGSPICGQKTDFRGAEAIAEAVQRPTMKFVATKTAEQPDLQALDRVLELLVSQRTSIINQIPGLPIGACRCRATGLRFLRAELPRILATPCDGLSPRMCARGAILRLAPAR
jgi:hypothetical protein